jgi:CMP-N,N'-diacetyllegionaminic acid synthase
MLDLIFDSKDDLLKAIRPGEILGLIPARGGSKRVKNKNILPLNGKPLINYTIEAAQKSKLINRIVVSTDSAEIAEVAKKAGAEIPFLRPFEIANENSTEFEFHVHALNELYKKNKYLPELIVNLYPTTPFRRAETIDDAIERLFQFKEAHSLRSTKKVSEHPFKMWTKDGDFLVPFVKKDNGATNTAAYHLLPAVQIQNASIYIVKTETLYDFNNTVGEKVLSFEMSEEESVDINTPLDFKLAEALLNS